MPSIMGPALDILSGNATLPILIGDITENDKDLYYQQHHGASLIFTIMEAGTTNNLIARGTGIQWNEQYQILGEPEWGARRVIELVEGAALPGQLSFQTMYFFAVNDKLPTWRSLGNQDYLQCVVQIASHERAELKGLVLDVFNQVKIVGQSGQWNANTKYLRNGSMLYLERMTGAEWVKQNSTFAAANADHGAYPAAIKG